MGFRRGHRYGRRLAFNLNGIEATSNGRALISVNTWRGTLYTIDPKTGNSALIDLGGASVPTGDGILLKGRTLHVLQNGLPETAAANQITVIKLRHHLTEGRVVDTIASPLFETRQRWRDEAMSSLPSTRNSVGRQSIQSRRWCC